MTNIILGFFKAADASSVRNLLCRKGFTVSGSCTSGANVLELCSKFGGGILVTGTRLKDMTAAELFSYLPESFMQIVIASPDTSVRFRESPRVKLLFTPVIPSVFISAIGEMEQLLRLRKERKRREKRPQLSDEERKTIEKAKQLLMTKHKIGEPAAHRLLQDMAMRSGVRVLETAQKYIQMEAMKHEASDNCGTML